MSSYVTIAPDGSRAIDVQSLFYDQIELVRRIARMNTAKVYAAPDGEELTIHQMVRHYPQWAARKIQEGEAAQQRIAELEGERDRLRMEISTMVVFMREAKLCPDWDRMPVRIHQNIDEIFRAIDRASQENPDAD